MVGKGADTGGCIVIVMMDSKKWNTVTVGTLEGEIVTTVLGKEEHSDEVRIT